MYPEIKKVFEALGWKAGKVKVDTSLKRRRDAPDFSVFGEDLDFPWIVGEAKPQKRLFETDKGVKEVLKEKKKYATVGTEWFVLVDPEIWVVMPVFGLDVRIDQKRVFDITDKKQREDLWKFLKDNLSPEAFAEQKNLRKFLEGDTSYVRSVDPEENEKAFFEMLERSFRLLEKVVKGLIPRAEKFWEEMKDHLDYFYSVASRGSRNTRDILRLTPTGVELGFPAYASADLNWEEFEGRLAHLSRKFKQNRPLFQFLYTYVWLQGRKFDEKLKNSLVFGTTMLLISRMLTIRFVEDHSFLGRRIFSNGGIESFVRFRNHVQVHMTDLVRYGTQLTEEIFPAITEETVYDWILYLSDQAVSRVIEHILYWLSFIDFSKVRGDLLSQIYTKMVSPGARKNLGQVFTPFWIAEYIADRILDMAGGELESILDPSCGSGTFLVVFFEKLAGEKLRRGVVSYEKFKREVEKIHGNDVDPFASALSRLQLLWHLIPFKDKMKGNPLPSLKVSTGDALNTETGLYETGSMWKIYSRRRYQSVVGNPPYVRPEILGEERKSLLDPLAKANLRAVFTYKALNDWVDEDGYLGFVLSLSVFDSNHEKPLRDMFRKEWTIKEIVDLELVAKEVFPEVAVNPVILIARKKKPSEGDKIVLRFLDSPTDKKGRDTLEELKTAQLGYEEVFTDDGRILTKVTPERLELINHIKRFPTFERIARSWWRKKKGSAYVDASLSHRRGWEESKMIGEGLAFRRKKYEGKWNVYKGENILACQLIDEPVEKRIDVSRASSPSFWRFPDVLPDKGFAFLQICLVPTACPFNPKEKAFLNTAVLFFPREELEDFPFDFLVLSSLYRFYYIYYLRKGVMALSLRSHMYSETIKKLPWSDKLRNYKDELKKLRDEYLNACKVTNLDIPNLLKEKIPLVSLEELGSRKGDLEMRFSEFGDKMEKGWYTVQVSLFEWVQVSDSKIGELLKEAIEVYGIKGAEVNEILTEMKIPDPDDEEAVREWKEIVYGRERKEAVRKKEEILSRLDEIVNTAFELDERLLAILEREKSQGLMRILHPPEPFSPRKLRGFLSGLDRADRYVF